MDAIGPLAHEWLRASPTWIKPNREELAVLTGCSLETMADVLAGAQNLHRQYGVNVLASCDAEGAVAVADGQIWRLHPLAVPVISPEGAGDAMVAGLATALVQEKSIQDSLRLSLATAAAAVMKEGVGECDRVDVERLLPEVHIEQLHPPRSGTRTDRE